MHVSSWIQATQPNTESMFTMNLQLWLYNTRTAAALNCFLRPRQWIACVHVAVAPSRDYMHLQMRDLDGVWRSINLSSCNLSCIKKRLELHNGCGMGVTVSGIRAGEKIQKLTGPTTSLALSRDSSSTPRWETLAPSECHSNLGQNTAVPLEPESACGWKHHETLLGG